LLNITIPNVRDKFSSVTAGLRTPLIEIREKSNRKRQRGSHSLHCSQGKARRD